MEAIVAYFCIFSQECYALIKEIQLTHMQCISASRAAAIVVSKLNK
uniref:Uncharacterized protein n=1 Tax=Ascaris lumbricoides TaxID=6252 RepID=A0A0M3I8K2_ASCLU